ncbi:MAG: adenine methyltransferase [Proteobacteria bacterium]|nr:adenine methyltransferase [Pseudomonadota bacterium]
MTRRFAAMSGHHSAASKSHEWFTPRAIIDALGPFDLDPCAPKVQPFPTASKTYTAEDNGLLLPWEGRIWLNPPYSVQLLMRFMARMAEHNHGTALIFARTETENFHEYVWKRASAVLFLRGRLNFLVGSPEIFSKPGREYRYGERFDQNAGAPSVLCAYGMRDADILAACEIDGQFVPLRIPRAVFGAAIASNEGEKINTTWQQIVREFFENREGPVELDELYRHVRTLPKAASNRNPEAKARQQLQRGPFKNVGRGQWQLDL